MFAGVGNAANQSNEPEGDLDLEVERTNSKPQTVNEKHKRNLLKWLVNADLLQEFDMTAIFNHPYQLDMTELSISNPQILKAIKVIMYKIGLIEHKQKAWHDEETNMMEKKREDIQK